jgi:hypothetical protein
MGPDDIEMPADAGSSMPRTMAQLPASLAPITREPAVSVERLSACVRRLDPGTRALLDLSVRRRLRDDAMAPLLRTDAFHLAWRRARALERVASDLGGEEPVPLAKVRAALEVLPREAWEPAPALPPAKEQGARSKEPVAPASTELVPASSSSVELERVGLSDRLDAFASSAPTLRQAFAGLGRAFGRKAVRLVVWRRRAAA